MKQQIMDLWKISFGDSDAFVKLWFDRIYKSEQTLVIEKRGKIVSALQIIPREMAYFGERIPVAYVCGVCTLPAERGKGHMTQLMHEAQRVMLERRFALATLIPNGEWLFGYYGRFGYATAFDLSVEMHRLRTQASSAVICRTVPSGPVTEEDAIYRLYDLVQSARGSCTVLHRARDLELARLDCLTDGGDCWVAHVDGQPAGIAFAVPEDGGTVFFKEIACDDGFPSRDALIQSVMKHYHAHAARVRIQPVASSSVPYGMARVLDAGRMYDICLRRNPLPATGNPLRAGIAACTQILLGYDRRAGYMNLMLD
ncbi:MAG: GNAT family N-acetyltransferase [Tannerella sp.]|jgi:GNAT superfamily N-acetyltransferase|nr:GNAT family N-acetyltransferase [Tannerella sp.]